MHEKIYKTLLKNIKIYRKRMNHNFSINKFNSFIEKIKVFIIRIFQKCIEKMKIINSPCFNIFQMFTFWKLHIVFFTFNAKRIRNWVEQTYHIFFHSHMGIYVEIRTKRTNERMKKNICTYVYMYTIHSISYTSFNISRRVFESSVYDIIITHSFNLEEVKNKRRKKR